MAGPEASDVLGRVVLVTGPEEFLNQRTVGAVVAAVRTHDPDSELSETTGVQAGGAMIADLAAPSLFSTVRCVVVRELEGLPEDDHAALLDYASSPAPDVGLVLVHSGGQRGSGLLTRLRKLPAVTEVKSATLRPAELPSFVAGEVRGKGGRIEPEAADLLVTAVGQDLRALAGAAGQLADDFPDRTISPDVVRRYFGGRAEVKSFSIADAALYGRTARALEELRWALDNGTAPVLVTSAFATSLRGLGRFKAAARGLREAELAHEAGVPPWKVRVLREQARGWDEDGVARAIVAVARADAETKGAASDAAYSLEQMVIAVSTARTGL